jgi:hypothetical protein
LLYKKDAVSNLRNVSIDDEITTSLCKFYVCIMHLSVQ